MAAPSGLEVLEAIRDGTGPPVGVAELLGMSVVELEEGRVVFGTRSGPAFGNPLGTLHGGITATLLDSAMGCAVQSALPAGVGYTTLDLNVTYLRAVALDGVDLGAEGRVVHLGGRVATAEGRLAVGGSDRPVATATCTCLVLRP
jgi:uncharacterized protein (TIGR00369 family)